LLKGITPAKDTDDMANTIIGIDPGVSGGFAWLSDEGPRAQKMPDTERDVWEFVSQFAGINASACIEQLGGVPRSKPDAQGNTFAKQSPTTMLTMGRNYGGLRMALVAAGIPFEEVLARKWQTAFGLLSRPGESKTAKKNRHKAKAQQLFPSLKVTLATCDAILLAEYWRRLSRPVDANSFLRDLGFVPVA
jgi:hypothetical protein